MMLLLGVFIILQGIKTKKEYDRKNSDPSFKDIIGLVIDNKKDYETDSDGHTSTVYYPIICYEVKDKKYTKKYPSSSYTRKPIGTPYRLKYNELDPEDIIFVGDKTYIGLIVVGTIMVIILSGFLLTFILSM